MKILILNWRDIKNPSSGGAEILTHEIAKRWVMMGHDVTQFSSLFHEGKREEIIDGVKFVRQGKWWSVHVFAFFYYLFQRKKIDVIIDEVHWFPFFSALYAPQKTVALICEVANKLFFNVFPYSVALFFHGLEKIYLYLYRKVPTMVISRSTYEDLINGGHKKSNIMILPMGLSLPEKIKIKSKEDVVTIMSLGRLNKQKGTMDVVEAFLEIKKVIKKGKLWLVGSGEKYFTEKLKQRIASYGLEDSVKLIGFVSEDEKFSLLSRSHFLVSASVQEGWGLTVPEAGLMKTPSVVYNVQGFRDIIEDKKDGLLVSPTPNALADGVIMLLKDKVLYKRIQVAAEKKARQYSWDNSARESLSFIKQEIIKKK